MPHSWFNPDGAVYFPDEDEFYPVPASKVFGPEHVKNRAPVYDWMIEMLDQDLDDPMVRQKLGERGWKKDAFEDYRNYVQRTCGSLNVRDVYRKWFGKSGQTLLPIWDRTRSGATEPIGWYNMETENYQREPVEKIHIDEPEIPLVMSWLRRQCRLG